MQKMTGRDLDINIHSKLIKDFTNFINSYSELMNTTEKYSQNMKARLLFEPVKMESVEVLEELSNTLVNFIPEFIKIRDLENDLEKYIN